MKKKIVLLQIHPNQLPSSTVKTKDFFEKLLIADIQGVKVRFSNLFFWKTFIKNMIQWKLQKVPTYGIKQKLYFTNIWKQQSLTGIDHILSLIMHILAGYYSEPMLVSLLQF